MLDTVPDGKTLLIEIESPRSVLPDPARVLGTSDMRQQIMPIAFDSETTAVDKGRILAQPAYWLHRFSIPEAERYGVGTAADLLARVEQAGLNGLKLRHSGPWVKELAAGLRRVGKCLYVASVNDASQARRLPAMGVAGITSERPGYVLRALARE